MYAQIAMMSVVLRLNGPSLFSCGTLSEVSSYLLCLIFTGFYLAIELKLLRVHADTIGSYQ